MIGGFSILTVPASLYFLRRSVAIQSPAVGFVCGHPASGRSVAPFLLMLLEWSLMPITCLSLRVYQCVLINKLYLVPKWLWSVSWASSENAEILTSKSFERNWIPKRKGLKQVRFKVALKLPIKANEVRLICHCVDHGPLFVSYIAFSTCSSRV